MSEEKTNPKTLSRREFLRNAGIVVGTTTVGSAFFLTACGEEKEITKTVTTTAPGTTNTVTTTAPGTTGTVTATQTATETSYICPLCEAQFTSLTALKTHFEQYHRGEGQIVIKSGYIEWDETKCVSCGRCMQACSTYHEGATSPKITAIKWFENKFFDGWDGEVPAYPFFCAQCTSPECYHACPLKDQALCIDEATGARYIVKEKCTGCGICEMACPLTPSRINMDTANRMAYKCDLCMGRPEGPTCVWVCDRQALKYVTKEERVL
ncbi:MAG: 4Fe-4S binding protein [Dehalococcoidales bacterium]|nr:4Fe-4S binding protein [Dehalococcoidales bacterium]